MTEEWWVEYDHPGLDSVASSRLTSKHQAMETARDLERRQRDGLNVTAVRSLGGEVVLRPAILAWWDSHPAA